MSESAAVIQKSEKLYFLINRRYIALIREKIEKTECSGIQQRAVEKEYALVSAGNGRKINRLLQKTDNSEQVKEIFIK